MLTVADVRGTNPKLWNSWKASLFEEFYERTKRALRRGLESPIDQDELMRETQAAARALLAQRGVDAAAVEQRLGVRAPTPISCATRRRKSPGTPPCSRRASPTTTRRWSPSVQHDRARRHADLRLHAAAASTALRAPPRCSIRWASTSSTRASRRPPNGFSLETYLVLEDNGRTISDTARMHEIEQSLWRSLQQPAGTPLAVTRRAPRQVRMFSTPTQVDDQRETRKRNRTILELIAGDRPGLAVGGRQDLHERAGRRPSAPGS